MMTMKKAIVGILLVGSSIVHGWVVPSGRVVARKERTALTTPLHSAVSPAISAESVPTASPPSDKKAAVKEAAYKEGGPLTVFTKLGAVNPYGIYYILTSAILGVFWYIALVGCQFLYLITGGRFDRMKRLPNFFTQMWGVSLMFLTRTFPNVENRETLDKFFETGQAAMVCGNHNSWLDIPFLGQMMGFRNYKFVSKAELGKVPILGKAIKIGGNLLVHRTDRRSQIQTLRSGIQWLKDGVHLCTFPEGTRSKSGRIGNFKFGAFKMAHKTGSPVIPVSIVGSGKLMPYYWLFPFRPVSRACKLVVHEPVTSHDKTEDELGDAVRNAIMQGLPEDQLPLE